MHSVKVYKLPLRRAPVQVCSTFLLHLAKLNCPHTGPHPLQLHMQIMAIQHLVQYGSYMHCMYVCSIHYLIGALCYM